VEPLKKIRIGVLTDPEFDILLMGIDADYFNVAAVKIGSDFHKPVLFITGNKIRL
jgi:hypothetical protein